MLVAPQTIEASLTALRLGRWGAQTCTVSDLAVAQALLPERSWHAVMIDRALGADAAEQLANAAIPHALRRIVLFTPAMRQRAAAYNAECVHRLSGEATACDLARRASDIADGLTDNRRR